MREFDIEEAGRVCDTIIDRVSQVFVGNRLLLRKLLAAALANGHVLFEDYPGLGKTLLAKVFTRAIAARPSECSSHPTSYPPISWARMSGGKTKATSGWSRVPCSPTSC